MTRPQLRRKLKRRRLKRRLKRRRLSLRRRARPRPLQAARRRTARPLQRSSPLEYEQRRASKGEQERARAASKSSEREHKGSKGESKGGEQGREQGRRAEETRRRGAEERTGEWRHFHRVLVEERKKRSKRRERRREKRGVHWTRGRPRRASAQHPRLPARRLYSSERWAACAATARSRRSTRSTRSAPPLDRPSTRVRSTGARFVEHARAARRLTVRSLRSKGMRRRCRRSPRAHCWTRPGCP